jgi:hypothetical protein
LKPSATAPTVQKRDRQFAPRVSEDLREQRLGAGAIAGRSRELGARQLFVRATAKFDMARADYDRPLEGKHVVSAQSAPAALPHFWVLSRLREVANVPSTGSEGFADARRSAMNEQTIHVKLSVHEARALIAAAELTMGVFGPDVRVELNVGPGETDLELAALRVESAIERQEVLA